MKPTKRDAWVMARLKANVTVDGEIGGVSPGFRPLVEEMARLSWEARQGIFRGFLLGRPDRDTFMRSIADIDPLEPPPEEEEEAEPLPVRLTCLADVEERPVEWLWDARVPLGTLTLWAGDPKLGKSFASLSLAAATSRGAAMPFGSTPPGPASVVLMSAEDDVARTIKPRLRIAGADLTKIHALESVIQEDGSEGLPTLSHDIALICDVAESLGDCRLIVIDPVSAYLGRVDDHRNAELRSVLSPLKAVAERLNLAVLLLTHLSKVATGGALSRVMGSMAYTGAARANSLFVFDRQDPTGRRRLMLHSGANLAPWAPTLAYTIEDVEGIGRVEWQPEAVDITAEQALATEQAAWQVQADAPERREAEEWLKEVLAEGPVSAKKVKAAAATAGIAEKTLKRAKTRLSVESVKDGFGLDAKWLWMLPPHGNA
jgi:hypothetical protein